MIKKYIYTLFFAGVIIIANQTIHSTPQGAPAGRSGSPADGATCMSSGCHTGTPTPQSNIISSDIPTEGYTPGQQYNISVTLSGAGAKGFMVSPQKTDGTLLGTLTSGAGSQVVQTKWITHTTPKNVNPGTWTFKWTAPASGTGVVDFYGAFAITRQSTLTDKYSVQEKSTTGVAENALISKLVIFPNPVVSDNLMVSFNLKSAEYIKINLVDLTGRIVAELSNKFILGGLNELNVKLPNINNGIYFIQLSGANTSLTKRILVNQ